MTPRLFHDAPLPAPDEPGAAVPVRVALDAAAAHHALDVLRLDTGATVELFNGDGWRYRARLERTGRRGADAVVVERLRADTESGIEITLAQVVPSGDKMDWVVEKAVELGASRLLPLSSQRSVVRLDAARAAKRAEHWRRIVIAACMQCGRDRLCALDPVQPLAELLAVADERGLGARLMLDPQAARPLAEAVAAAPAARRFALLVGPESGLTDAERQAAIAGGWQPVGLGSRTLRTETAGLAAIAALQAFRGDFAGSAGGERSE